MYLYGILVQLTTHGGSYSLARAVPGYAERGVYNLYSASERLPQIPSGNPFYQLLEKAVNDTRCTSSSCTAHALAAREGDHVRLESAGSCRYCITLSCIVS